MSVTSKRRTNERISDHYSDPFTERYSDGPSVTPTDAEGREQRVESRGQRVEVLVTTGSVRGSSGYSKSKSLSTYTRETPTIGLGS